MMEYKRFSLGLRFAMTQDAGLTPERAWELLFSRVSPNLAHGLTLFGVWDLLCDNEPERAYICVFSNLSHKRAKSFYRALVADCVLGSYLTAYQPVIQQNRVERCGEAEYLGTADAKGVVTGGDVRYAQMCFCASEPIQQMPKPPRILIVTEAMGDCYSAADAGRRLMRQAAKLHPEAEIRLQRISDGGRGTLDAMIAACNGRYEICAQTGVRYGVLPDRTAVFETEPINDEQIADTLHAVAHEGYRSILLAAGKRRFHVALPEDLDVTILTNPVLDETPEQSNVHYASGVETILRVSGFLHKLAGARAVVLGTMARDESCELLGATADSIRYHCGRQKVPFAVLALCAQDRYILRAPNDQAETLAHVTLDEAADQLFSRIRRIL